jgi:hypothetical protein
MGAFLADESRTPAACQQLFSALSAFFSFMGVSPSASKKDENHLKIAS